MARVIWTSYDNQHRIVYEYNGGGESKYTFEEFYGRDAMGTGQWHTSSPESEEILRCQLSDEYLADLASRPLPADKEQPR